jgi:hypothetical protein
MAGHGGTQRSVDRSITLSKSAWDQRKMVQSSLAIMYESLTNFEFRRTRATTLKGFVSTPSVALLLFSTVLLAVASSFFSSGSSSFLQYVQVDDYLFFDGMLPKTSFLHSSSDAPPT